MMVDNSTQFKSEDSFTDLAGFRTTPCFNAKLHLFNSTWSVCDWPVSSMVMEGTGSQSLSMFEETDNDVNGSIVRKQKSN